MTVIFFTPSIFFFFFFSFFHFFLFRLIFGAFFLI